MWSLNKKTRELEMWNVEYVITAPNAAKDRPHRRGQGRLSQGSA